MKKTNGEKKLIIGAILMLTISAMLFGLGTDQGLNLIKNIKEAITARYAGTTANAVNVANAKIVGGYNHFVALKTDGTVWGWGLNTNGQLGEDDDCLLKPQNLTAEITLADGTVKKESIDDAIDIAAGRHHTLIVRKDGTVWASGLNTSGQLGDGTTDSRAEFHKVLIDSDGNELKNIVKVGAADLTSYAITKDGEVYAWGENLYGQIGIGNKVNQLYPVKMEDVSNIVNIVAGERHAIMLDADGNVWGVGYNYYGQLGIGNTTTQLVPVQMLDENGEYLTGVKEIASGRFHTVILKNDNTVWDVGYNGKGILGNGATTNATIITQVRELVDNEEKMITDAEHITASGDSTFISRKKASSGKNQGMYVIGYNNYGQLFTYDTELKKYATQVEEDKHIIAMALTRNRTGNYNSQTGAIVDEEGNVYAVGYNGSGEIGNDTWQNLTEPWCISNKKIHVSKNIINFQKSGQQANIQVNETVEFNLLSNDVPTPQYTYESLDTNVATVDSSGKVTSKSIGTTYVRITDKRNNTYAEVKINVVGEGNITFPKIVGGFNHFIALKADGTVWAWGSNGLGQLGIEDIEYTNKPVQTNMEDVMDIAAGRYYTLVLKKDGTVWATGQNTYGQLGDGSVENTGIFHKVKLNENGDDLDNIVQITAEAETSHALAADGTVYSWGYNTYGELGINEATKTDANPYPVKMQKVSNIVQISAGERHLIMLDASGTVWGVGYNNAGQLGIGKTGSCYVPEQMLDENGEYITGVKEIAAGRYHTVIMKDNNTVWSVGYNGKGVLGNGATTNTSIISQVRELVDDEEKMITDAKHITAAGDSTYVSRQKKSNGQNQGLYVMGWNYFGQLFTGDKETKKYAVPVETDKDILTMALTQNRYYSKTDYNYQTGAIVDEDGNIYTVGYNGHGEMGNETFQNLTDAWCISNAKITVEKNVINFQNAGEKEKINVTETVGLNLLSDNLPTPQYIYESLDTNVATVDENGIVTAKEIGTTFVRIKDERNNVYAAVKINVTGSGNVTYPKIVAGFNHFVALKADGTVWTWGTNGNGQLGLGDIEYSNKPVQTNMKNVVDIAAGRYYTLVLKKDGTVWATGYNGFGQLGDGGTVSTDTFHKVKLNENGDYLQNIIQIDAEIQTSHALTADGTVYSWGYNKYGQFGIDEDTKENANPYPVKMQKVSNIIQISAGEEHLSMLDASGSVWSVGYNGYGQFGTGTTTTYYMPERMLDENGDYITGVKEIASGRYHTLIKRADDSAWAVGCNSKGALGTGTATTTYKITPVVQLVEKNDGSGETEEQYVTGVKHLAAGGDSSFISRQKSSDGKNQGMYVSGWNNYGQLFTEDKENQSYATIVQTDKDILTMALTQSRYRANSTEQCYQTGAIVDEDGMVYTVGYNAHGEMGNETLQDLTTPWCISQKKLKVAKSIIDFEKAGEQEKIEVSSNLAFNLLRDDVPNSTYKFETMDSNVATVDQNGLVTAKGIGTTYVKVKDETNNLYKSVKINVTGEENKTFAKIIGGYNHFVALKADGTVWTWGANGSGQLGLGDYEYRDYPVKTNMEDVIDIAAGRYHTMVLKRDGTVWTAGYNAYGQLGDGTTTTVENFQQVVLNENGEPLKNIVQIVSEDLTSHALTADGDVYSWGYNNYGQLGINETSAENANPYPVKMQKVSNIMQMSAGQTHISMLDADGSVWSVGYNTSGQLGTGNNSNYKLPTQMLDENKEILYGVKEIASGRLHTVLIRNDNTVWSVGNNGKGVLGNGGTTSVYIITPVLKQVEKADGTIEEQSITDAKHLSVAGDSTFISRQKTLDGQNQGMYVMGWNRYGQLFTQDMENKLYAIPVETDKDILTMALTKDRYYSRTDYNYQTGAIVDEDGKVYTVGYNGNGEIGNETTENLTTPWCISNLKITTNVDIINYKKVGENSEKITCELTMGFNLLKDTLDCKKYTFSSLDEKIATVNQEGRVTATGIGTTYIRIHNEENDVWKAVKVNVNGEQGTVQPKIVGGYNHFVALRANGTVWTWGANSNGQLGTGDYEYRAEPTEIKAEIIQVDGTTAQETINDAIDIAAGRYHTLILRKDGTVWSSGYNGYYQLGDGTNETRNVFRQVLLNSNGEYLKDVVQIVSEDLTSHALKSDGTVYSWGYNAYGQIGISDKGDPEAYPVKMKKVSSIIQMSAGEEHLSMLDADGSVWSVGYNGNGQFGIGKTSTYYLPIQMLDENKEVLHGVKEIASGREHTVIIKDDNTVWSVGYNGKGVLGNGGTSSTSIITQVRELVEKDDGSGETEEKMITDAKHVSASGDSTFISRQKTSDGQNQGLYVMGWNKYGQLFTQDTENKIYATPVETDKDILTMAFTKNRYYSRTDYNYQTGAIADMNGTVYTVGYNGNGEIGNGTTENLLNKACISNVKLQVTPTVINYKKAGDTGTQIGYTVSTGFNLLYDQIEQGTCKYKTLDSDIATVDDKGVVTATGAGITYIRVYNTKNDCYGAVRVQVNGEQGRTFAKIAGGRNHFVALKANGEIWSWGYNGYGQLGLSDTERKTKPTKTNIYDSTDATQTVYAIDVSAGDNHTLVLKSDGTVWASGLNNYGQLGIGNTDTQTEFVQVAGIPEKIIEISANGNTSYALGESGKVYGWGNNSYGQLGINSKDTQITPVRMQKISNVIQISAGENHAVMLDADGSVWSVGYNRNGQFGINNTTTKYLPQQMLTEDGTAILKNIKKVVAGKNHTIVLTEDGTAYGVGYNGYGQLGLGDTNSKILPTPVLDTEGNTITDIKDIVANGNMSMISVKPTTDASGNTTAGVYVAGYNNYGQLFTKDNDSRVYFTKVEEDKNIIAMATTSNITNQTSAIADDLGIVYTVGYNGNGEMGDGTINSTIEPTSISDADLKVNARKIILNLDTNNITKQLDASTDLGFNILFDKVTGEKISYKTQNSNIATVSSTGLVTGKSYGTTKIEVTTNKLPNKVLVEVQVLRKNDVAMPKTVSGQEFTVALKADGTVWTWGYNGYGQLGLGDDSNRYKPTQISITDVVDIAAGNNHVLLVTKEGKVYSFGSNSYGQLGRDGNALLPEEIPNLENIDSVSAGAYHSMALGKDGSVYTWGYNGNSQLGDGTKISNATPNKIRLSNIIKIEAGNQTSTAIDGDGNLYAWGYNGSGQLGNETKSNVKVPRKVLSLEEIVDVAVENNTIIAVNDNGDVLSSGYNGYGNLGINSTGSRTTFGRVIEKIEDGEITYLTDVKSVTAGLEYAVAIKNDGTAVTWGLNSYGQSSNGTKSNNLLPVELRYAEDQDVIDQIISVSASSGTTVVAREDGKVWTIGRNDNGQLGNSSAINSMEFVCISKPVLLFEETPIKIHGIGKTKNAKVNMSQGFNLLFDTVDGTDLTYEIRNDKIATVNSSTGVITSVKKGKTQIKATDKKTGETTSADVYVLGEDDITFPQIESNNYATVTLKSNGEIWSYGNNNHGQLGTGDTKNKVLPTYTGINNISQIALGRAHGIAVDTDGHVWTWGNNAYGQLGNGTTGKDSLQKEQVKSPDGTGVLENIVSVAAGDLFSMALDKDGNVYTWGYNYYGQLGLGNKVTRTLPVKVDNLQGIIKITAGNSSAFAIDNDNNLWVAGYNGYGNLGDGTTGNKLTFTRIETLANVAEVSASPTNSTIVLLEDGTVWGFGYNKNNQLTVVGGSLPQQLQGQNGTLKDITAIGTGYYTGYAITSEEKVLAWGLDNYGQLATGTKTTKPIPVYMKDKDGNDFTDAMIVSGGVYNTELAKSDGTVWSVGYNGYGELGDGSKASRTDLECISTQYIKLEEREKTLKLSNPNYQINPKTVYGFNLLFDEIENTGFTYTSSDDKIATVNKTTGKVIAKGLGKAYITVKSNNTDYETRVVINVIGEDKKVREKVQVGNTHSLALKQDGTIWAWGSNTKSISSTEPVQIEKGKYTEIVKQVTDAGTVDVAVEKEKDLNDIKDIATGYTYNLALDSDGYVYSWGYNGYGQLGDGSTTTRTVPTRIEGLEEIEKVYCYKYTSMALNKNGEIYIWGNGYGRSPIKLNFSMKVIDLNDRLILAEDGSVWNLSSNPSKVEGLQNIVEVTSGEDYYAVLDTKGKVYVWGANANGQLSQGNLSNLSTPTTVKIENSDGTDYEELENIVEIQAGNKNLQMLSSSGEIYSSGNNESGQLGVGNNTKSILIATKAINMNQTKNIDTNTNHSIASDVDGFVYTTGYNANGQLGLGSNVSTNEYTIIGGTYIHLSANRITLEEGKDQKVTATLNNKFNLIEDVIDSSNIKYETLNDEIATVDSDGTIHGKKMGTVEILVTHTITHKTTTIFVQVVPEEKTTVPKLEIGATHTAALKADGTVWVWGDNTYGQLGTENNIDRTSPTKVMSIEKAIDISVGNYNTIVVKDDGTVWTFGYNGYGQLGDGTSSNRNVPVQVVKADGAPLTKIVKVAGGKNRTVALDEDGNVWTWGYSYSKTATKLSKIDSVIDISLNYVVTQSGKVYTLEGSQLDIDNILRVSEGESHALFLTREGTGYSIGKNNRGQLGDGTTVDKTSATMIKNSTGTGNLEGIKELKAGTEFSIAIMKNGDTYTWGSSDDYKTSTNIESVYPIQLQNINKAISGDAGAHNGGIIDEQGFVYMWGLGEYGNLGNGLYNTSSNLVLVGAEEAGLDEYDIVLHKGETHQITVTNKTFNVLKEIHETGEISYDIGNSGIASISKTGLVTGVKEGKTTAIVTKVSTGATSIANVTVLPEGVEIEPMAITCMSHTVVLKANGTVWAYGQNSSYELGDGTSTSSDKPVQVKFPDGVKIMQIAVGNTHNLALDTEGNVWVWGSNANDSLGTALKKTPAKLGLSNVKKIAANNDQSMVLTKDGYVYVWGLNSNGELGVGTYNQVKTPTLLTYVNNVLDISIGKNHTMLLTTNGKVLTSGLNVYGQTGKNDGKSNTFTEIEVPEVIGKISAGDNHSVLLSAKGNVYTFGYNESGQLGLGTKTNVTKPTKTKMTNVMEISAGKNHTIVLGANRILYSTGSNSNGQLGIGIKDDKLLFTKVTKVKDMMKISAGNTYSVAIKYNGDVYGWGDYYHGTSAIQTKTNSRIPVKIGNDETFANEPEIAVNVNGTKQIQITPKYTFNVFKDGGEEESDFNFESINSDIATVDDKGLVTGVKVGTTWVKATEKETGKENVVMVRVIEEDSISVPQVAGGDGYAAVLKADGSIWGFGYNSDGQLGNDKLAPANIPSQTNILATYTQVDAGKRFTLALRSDGTVWAWGDNTYGELGQGNRVSARKPVQVQNLSNIVAIAAGENHAMALDSLGNVYTWGLNSKGQLGNGTVETVSIPEKINGLDNQIVKIAAGGNLSALIDSKGDVYVFGDNSKEQIEEFTYNYDSDGQKIMPPLNTYLAEPVKVESIENAVKVQCMQDGIVVLKSDGSVERTTKYARQTNVEKTVVVNAEMVDISGTNGSVVLLDKYGASYTYGDNTKGQAGIGGTSTSTTLQEIKITDEKEFLNIGAGYKNNYVIDTKGFVYGAGANEYGQLGNGTYDDSYEFTLVGDKKFEIVPDARNMEQPEQEIVTIIANVFNVFNHNEKSLTDYDWKSSNPEVVTVADGVLNSQDMGVATITATDKITGATATALRVVQPLDEQRIDNITVNNKTAKVSGENKYEVSVSKNPDGTGTLKITTKNETDEISIDEGTTYVTGTLEQDIPLDSNPTIVKIKVRTTNGKEVDYILTINILSQDVSLIDLTVNDVPATPVGATEYEIVIKDTVTKPEVTAVANDENATVSIDASIPDKKQTTRTVDMTTVIKKVIPVQVTAENGDKVTYNLTIYKEDALTQLETVTVDGKEAVKIGDTAYKAIIPASSDSVQIMAKTLYDKARAEVNKLGEEVHITTKVVATIQNQTVVKIYVRFGTGESEREREYTLTLDKEGTEDIQGLLSVTVNGQEIEPIGNIYNAYIGESTQLVTATAITVSDNDLVKIGENDLKVHTAAEILTVDGEVTTYKITVTDPNDITKSKEYILNLKKPSANNSLLSITVGNKEFSKEAVKVPKTNIYRVHVSDKYQAIDVIAKAGYELSQVSVNGEDYEIETSIREVTIGDNEPTKVEVLVKAINGDVASYTLEIYKEDSNTGLKEVTVDGNKAQLSQTAEDTYEYTLDKVATDLIIGAVTEEPTSKVGINTNEQEIGATYRDVKMEGKTLTVSIPVTAEDGTEKVYKLIIYALPDNVNLISVKVNGKEADSVPVNKYESRVNKNDTSFELYVIPEDPKAKVQIDNNMEVVGTSSATIPKNSDEVQVKIKVTAQDGTVQEYILIVTNQSDDCNLAILKVDGETIEPDETGVYHVTKAFLTSSVDVDAIANNSRATVSINEEAPTLEEQKAKVATPDLNNVVKITVTAEDGTTKEYTLIVEKLPNETGAEITISYEQDGDIEEKTVSIDKDNKGTIRIGNQEKVDLKVVAVDALAQISIDGAISQPGQDSQEISTIQETTIVPVQVIAQDGTVTDYEITIIRASNNAELKSVNVDGVEDGDIIKTSDNTYVIKVPDTMSDVDLTAIAESEYATVKIEDGDYSENNEQQATIAMDSDVKTIKVTVRAENGETKEYTVTLQKVTDLGLESVEVNNEECITEEGDYVAFIDIGSTEATLKIKPKNPAALISMKQGTDGTWGDEKSDDEHINKIAITGEETKVLIRVKDPNDSTRIKEYSVIIKHKSNIADIELVQVDDKNAIETDDGYYAVTTEDATTAKVYVKAANKYAKVSIAVMDAEDGESTRDVPLSDKKETIVVVTITAQDGTSKTYNITIERKSKDTSCVIEINDAPADEIDEKTNTYTKYIELDDTEATVRITSNNPEATIEMAGETQTQTITKTVEIASEVTEIDAIVTAENGDKVVYHIRIVKKSTDATIKTVKVDNQVIPETDGKYTATVYDKGGDTQDALVEVIANESHAKIQIGDGTEWQQTPATSTQTFKDGNRKIVLNINVESQNGEIETKELEINIVSDDVSIKVVKEGDNVITLYDEATHTYTEYLSKDVENVSLMIEANSNYTTLTSGDITGIPNIAITNISMTGKEEVDITFTATAESGRTQQYTIKLLRKSSNADAAHIYVDGIDIIDSFEDKDSVPTAIISIGKLKENTSVRVISENAFSTIKIGDADEGIGDVTRNMKLDLSSSTITVPLVITSQDGTVTKTYNIMFVRLSNDTKIQWLEVNKQHLIEDEDGNYEVTVKASEDIANVKIILSNVLAKVTMGGEEKQGQLEENVILPNGDVKKTITITAVDGTVRTCTLTIHKAQNNLGLAKVYLDGRIATKVDDTTFEIDVIKGTTQAEIKAIASKVDEYVSIQGNTSTQGQNIYSNCSLTNKEIPIKVSAMFNGELDQEKNYILKIKEIEAPDVLEDLKVKIKVDGQEITQGNDGIYLAKVDSTQDNSLLWAGVTSETSQVKIKDSNGETIYDSPSNQKNISLQGDITDVIVTVKNGAGEEKTYTVRIQKKPPTVVGKVITQASDQTNQSAKIKVYKTSDNRVENDATNPREVIKEIDINPDGTYALGLKDGEYDLVVTKTSYLEYRLTNIVIKDGEPITINDIYIYAGDLDESGEIEIEDLTSIVDNYGTITAVNEAQKGKYDLNEDGVVDKLDRNILKANYGKTNTKEQWVNPNAVSTMSLTSENEIAASATAPVQTELFVKPLKCKYTVTSSYGTRTHPTTGVVKKHTGIDIAGVHHAEVVSIADGEVTYAGVQNGFGNCVEIKHIVNGETIYSFYAHLSKIEVQKGQSVKQGQTIGLEGGDPNTDPNPGNSTGHHLHFEVRKASGYGNDIDPTKYI